MKAPVVGNAELGGPFGGNSVVRFEKAIAYSVYKGDDGKWKAAGDLFMFK